MALSNLGERSALNATLGAGLQVALYTVAPNYETGAGGTEVSGGSYARQSITFSSASTNVSGVTTAASSSEVIFPVATASYGTVVAAAIFSGGSMVWGGNLSASKAVGNGDQFRFPAAAIVLSIE
jgi:hypothetical protein